MSAAPLLEGSRPPAPDAAAVTGRSSAGGPLLVAITAAVLAAATSWVIGGAVLDHVPHVTDGVSYSFQGRIFASGHLWLAPPPEPHLFAHENIVVTATRWCSRYTPGWPLLLALGWLCGAPWAVPPLLLGVAVLGAYRLGSVLFDARTGALAAVALAGSPFALLMSADVLSHTPALAACTWCLALLADGVLARTPEDASPKSARMRLLAAGLVGAYAFLIRPFTAVVLLLPAVVWALLRLRRRTVDGNGAPLAPTSVAALAALAVGALPCVLLFLLYNRVLFGGFLTTGYAVDDPARYAHAGALWATPGEALFTNLPWFLGRLGAALWGLPGSDWLLFVPLVVAAILRRPGWRFDALLAVSAGALIAGYAAYYYHDEVYYSGPRLVFEALGPLAVLAARSVLAVVAWVRTLGLPRGVRLAFAAAGAALLLWFPLGRRLPEQMLRESGWYLAVSGEPLRRMGSAGVGKDALVFVAGTGWCYSGLFLANDMPWGPDGRSGRVFVRDIPPLRATALRLYPRPEIWQAKIVVSIPDPEHAPDVARPETVEWTRLR